MTSQIFANIYLNELDRFVVYNQQPLAYLRYGDDFLIFERDLAKLKQIRENVIEFANDNLGLMLNKKNDIIVNVKSGLKFLGVEIFPTGRKLKKRNVKRISERLSLNNAPSYHGLVKMHNPKKLNELNWKILEKLENE